MMMRFSIKTFLVAAALARAGDFRFRASRGADALGAEAGYGLWL